MIPKIAIPVPTSGDAEYNRQSWIQYAEAVRKSGGEPIEVALGSSPVETMRLIAECQGVLLPGSPADVNPEKYGAEREGACAPTDHARENVDELLIQDAHNLYKPILAICFGAQMLNVWRGGTLIQDLPSTEVNHKAGKAVAVAHAVTVQPGSRMADCAREELGSAVVEGSQVGVNSSHHQAIAVPGDGLVVTATSSKDGVIEAVEGQLAEHFVLAVQWHPERSYEISAASRAIFEGFLAHASAWVERPIHTSVG
jgi:putative glutamine amidotransferase